MLSDVIEFLACPACGEGLVASGPAVACPNRHSFDVARQSYVNLLLASEKPGTADTAEMVAAREDFLRAGHFDPLASAIAEAVALAASGQREGCILEAGAGTGFYLAAALERVPERAGLALDISKQAAKRATRAHPRIGAVVADTWTRLPVRDAAAAVVLDVFAPRNFPEFARVLTPGGALVIATPTGRHLAELVGLLGLVTVDERKEERLARATEGIFELERAVVVEGGLELSRAAAAALVAMGPSARHSANVTQARLESLTEPIAATLSATVATYHKPG